MRTALAGVPSEWYPTPLDQFGNDYYLPGTEYVAPFLAEPWPVCPQSSYDPTQTTWNDISVNGVPCTLATQFDFFSFGQPD